MSDLNRVTLIGRLTRDPEVRHTSGGMPIVQLGLAVNGREKNPAGEWVDRPNFFDVKLFGDRFERLAGYLAKGKRIGVDGRLEWQSWEKDGAKRSKIEIIANDVQMLDTKDEAQSAGQGQQSGVTQSRPVAANDDDLPF